MSGFPKQKRPHNMRVLQSWIREYADQQQMAESRVRRAVSFMLTDGCEPVRRPARPRFRQA